MKSTCASYLLFAFNAYHLSLFHLFGWKLTNRQTIVNWILICTLLYPRESLRHLFTMVTCAQTGLQTRIKIGRHAFFIFGPSKAIFLFKLISMVRCSSERIHWFSASFRVSLIWLRMDLFLLMAFKTNIDRPLNLRIQTVFNLTLYFLKTDKCVDHNNYICWFLAHQPLVCRAYLINPIYGWCIYNTACHQQHPLRLCRQEKCIWIERVYKYCWYSFEWNEKLLWQFRVIGAFHLYIERLTWKSSSTKILIHSRNEKTRFVQEMQDSFESIDMYWH